MGTSSFCLSPGQGCTCRTDGAFLEWGDVRRNGYPRAGRGRAEVHTEPEEVHLSP